MAIDQTVSPWEAMEHRRRTRPHHAGRPPERRGSRACRLRCARAVLVVLAALAILVAAARRASPPRPPSWSELAPIHIRTARRRPMTIDRVDRTVVTTTGPAPCQPPCRADAARPRTRPCARRAAGSPRPGPGGPELGRRIVVLVFGLIQVVIGARFVLLLLDAREANGLVSGILNLSQLFVAPVRRDPPNGRAARRAARSSTSPRSWPSSAGRSSSSIVI